MPARIRALGIGTLVVGLALLAAAVALAVFVLRWADRLSEGGHWGFFAALRGFFFGAFGLLGVLLVAGVGIGYLWSARRQLLSAEWVGATSLAGVASGVLLPFTVLPTLIAEGGEGWLSALADAPLDGALFALFGSHALACLASRPAAAPTRASRKAFAFAPAAVVVLAIGGGLAIPLDAWDARIRSTLSLRTIASHREPVRDVAVRGDGGLFVVSGGGVLTAFRTADGREIWKRRLAGSWGKSDGVGFSADGRWLLCVLGRNVHVIDAESGAIAHRLAHDNDVNSVALVAPSRAFVTAPQFSDGLIVWDAASGAVRRRIDAGCKSLASAGTEAVVWSLCDGTPTAWNVDAGERARAVAAGRHKEIAVAPDGSRVVTLEGFVDRPRTLRVYEAAALRELASIEVPGGQELLGCVDGCKTWLVAGNSGLVLVDVESSRVTPWCRGASAAAAAADVIVTAGGSCTPEGSPLRAWRTGELPGR